MSKPKVIITAVDGHTGTSIAQHITNSTVKDSLGGLCGLAESGECGHLKDKGIHIKQLDTLSPPEKMVETFKKAEVVVLVPSALPLSIAQTCVKHPRSMPDCGSEKGVADFYCGM